MDEKSYAGLDDVSMFSLSDPILLGSVRARDSVLNSLAIKELGETMVFSAAIRLEGTDFRI
jgi:hypothetical protein